MELIYDEEQETWVGKPEPYATIDVPTEEDHKMLLDALDLWHELRELGKYNLDGDAREFFTWMSTVNRLIEQYTAVPSKRESEEDENN